MGNTAQMYQCKISEETPLSDFVTSDNGLIFCRNLVYEESGCNFTLKKIDHKEKKVVFQNHEDRMYYTFLFEILEYFQAIMYTFNLESDKVIRRVNESDIGDSPDSYNTFRDPNTTGEKNKQQKNSNLIRTHLGQ